MTPDKNQKRMILHHKKYLPIATVEKELIEEVRKNDILIIVGETGSGKTTQLPQFLWNAGFCGEGKVVGITQPRRVAAVTVAKRVAEECDVEIGQRVGYAIRFEDVTSSSTRIKYMTDGLLLREALVDPYLSRYSVIIIDEAHERTIHTDVLLGLLKNMQKLRSQPLSGEEKSVHLMKQHEGKRPHLPLKLIIMSASLDARAFSEFFGGARAVHVMGRKHPVDIYYTFSPEMDYIDAAIISIFQIHLEEEPGDVLVFLTGQEEIEAVERLVHDRMQQLSFVFRNIVTVPIFSSLPSELQLRVFRPAPAGFRKVILATNIAETSVTIPGIKYVVDTGLVKMRTYDCGTGMESLVITKTSKAQALQRSGRAGRHYPGKCFRLYPESEFKNLNDSTPPEIKHCNLSNVILQLKSLGIDDIIGFDFMDKPDRMAVLKSLEQLLLLGALTDDYKLSDPVGLQMARLPLDPVYSKALILSDTFHCSEEMLITVAMLSAESMFYTDREKTQEVKAVVNCFTDPEGDHMTLVNVFRGSAEVVKNCGDMKEKADKSLWKWCKDNFVNFRSLRHARDIYSQINNHVQKMGMNVTSCGDDTQQFRRCLTASFFLNAALKQPDGIYRGVASGLTVQIHPTSVMFRKKPECVIFNEMVRTSHNYIRNVTSIDPFWLPELAPHFYSSLS